MELSGTMAGELFRIAPSGALRRVQLMYFRWVSKPDMSLMTIKQESNGVA